MTDIVGKKLKDFYVLRRLGRGAMAEVYLAQQLSLARQVALKVLNGDLARDPNFVRRFHQEARAAAALVHAGIVQIYEVGEEDGVHYIAQEYVAGRNLGEVIRSRGSLEPRVTLDILRQVAAALGKAASVGIVHRDIKPENIMLARSGEVKVADFGLARVQGVGATNLTQAGVTMGTPLYMSPEQIEGRELDSRSDIYSLGVTAYHMLAGEPPFTGDSPLSVAVLHLNQPAPPLANRRADVPPRFANVVERMLAKKPDDRHADPAALLADLHELSIEGAEQGWADQPVNWSLTDTIRSADDRSEATARLDHLMKTSSIVRPSRSPARWLAVGLIACALFGIGAAALTRPDSLLGDSANGSATYDNVWEQLLHAKRFNTERAWLDALNHSDAKPTYEALLATKGLAYYYLDREQDYDKALKPLNELAGLPQAKAAFRTFGIAGLVIAYANLGRIEEADREYRKFSQLSPDMRAQFEGQSPQMSDLLDEALEQLLYE